MYSPKIKPDLIPMLYILGKEQGKPMTQIVDDILREYLTKIRMITSKTVYEVKQETMIIRNGGMNNAV